MAGFEVSSEQARYFKFVVSSIFMATFPGEQYGPRIRRTSTASGGIGFNPAEPMPEKHSTGEAFRTRASRYGGCPTVERSFRDYRLTKSTRSAAQVHVDPLEVFDRRSDSGRLGYWLSSFHGNAECSVGAAV
jgi:hypothetical protein